MEIDTFQSFGVWHVSALLVSVIAAAVWIAAGSKAENERTRRMIGIAFACFIIAVRSVRYVMDIAYGRFEIYDLLSLHICHIDLILLAICLIRPNKFIYSFTFMIGIPMGLAVALFPGSTHPAPGIARALFFIGSHMMLAGGAVYLTIVEKLKVEFRHFLVLAGGGIIGTVLIYGVNKFAGTNFLYLMGAPEGTVIESMEKILGYPGYVFAMIALALALMFLLFVVSNVVSVRNMVSGKKSEAEGVAT